jgi:flavin reductase (DIM6/NTAB) family NADH-FMN oxidoreductase RutF
MAAASAIKNLLKRLLLGGQSLPQEVTVAICEPQDEIVVWLIGAEGRRDVTSMHSIACASPFTVCIPFQNAAALERECGADRASLELRERRGRQRLLGKIGLRFSKAIQVRSRAMQGFRKAIQVRSRVMQGYGTAMQGYSTATEAGEGCLGLFHARSCVNYCMPRVRFWAHYMQQVYWRRRDGRTPGVAMPALDAHAIMVMFICPRPVVLVTAMEERGGNLFPMNLMGPLGEGRFALALNREREAAQCVKRAGRVALSSIPFEKAAVARQLGKHHLQATIEWDQLPFGVRSSRRFGVPVPEFALRVKELEIESVEELGSHTFFVARVVEEEICAPGPNFFMIHGIYEKVRAR